MSLGNEAANNGMNPIVSLSSHSGLCRALDKLHGSARGHEKDADKKSIHADGTRTSGPRDDIRWRE